MPVTSLAQRSVCPWLGRSPTRLTSSGLPLLLDECGNFASAAKNSPPTRLTLMMPDAWNGYAGVSERPSQPRCTPRRLIRGCGWPTVEPRRRTNGPRLLMSELLTKGSATWPCIAKRPPATDKPRPTIG